MNARATLGLAIAFAALLTAYWLTGKIDRSATREARDVEPVFTFQADDIDGMRIAQLGAAPVEATRDRDGIWSIVQPHAHIPANQALWNRLATALTAVTNQRTIDDAPTSLADFQLDQPALTIVVEGGASANTQIAFGSLDPTQVNRYARVGDGPVFLAPSSAFEMLNRTLDDLRDRRIFTHLEGGIPRVDFVRHATGGAEELEDASLVSRSLRIDESYEVDDTGFWHLARPTAAVLQQERIVPLAAYLRLAVGRGYIDEPESLSDYGLDPPFAELRAHNVDGETHTLLLGWLSGGDDEGGIFVKRADSSSVYVADSRLFLLLPAEPQDYREKRLFTHAATTLKTIRYEDAQNVIELEHDDELGWQMIEPPSEDTDQIAVSMYIAMLKSIEGVAFPEETEIPSLATPRVTLDFSFTDDTPPSTVLLGGPLSDTVPPLFYARQDIGVVTAIPFDALRMLQAEPFDFRIKRIFPFEASAVEHIDLLFEDRRYVYRLEEGNWILEEPRGARLESQADVRALLETFVQCRASGIVDTEAAADAQLDPILRVSFGISGSGQSITLGPIEVGARTDANSRQRHLRIPGKTTPYLVDQALISDVRDALQGVVFSQP